MSCSGSFIVSEDLCQFVEARGWLFERCTPKVNLVAGQYQVGWRKKPRTVLRYCKHGFLHFAKAWPFTKAKRLGLLYQEKPLEAKSVRKPGRLEARPAWRYRARAGGLRVLASITLDSRDRGEHVPCKNTSPPSPPSHWRKGWPAAVSSWPSDPGHCLPPGADPRSRSAGRWMPVPPTSP
jgi:hypothetical protein